MTTDFIVNLGVIIAGGLVYLTISYHPLLIIGTRIFFIVRQGAFKKMKLSNWRFKDIMNLNYTISFEDGRHLQGLRRQHLSRYTRKWNLEANRRSMD